MTSDRRNPPLVECLPKMVADNIRAAEASRASADAILMAFEAQLRELETFIEGGWEAPPEAVIKRSVDQARAHKRRILAKSPSSKIKELADQLELETGRTIDRGQFYYLIHRATEALRLSRSSGQMVTLLREQREDAKSAQKAALEAADALRVALQRVVEIERRLVRDKDIPPPHSLIRTLPHITSQLDCLETILNTEIEYHRPSKGRPRKEWWTEAVWALGRAWVEATNEIPSASWRRRTGDRRGNFVDFVASILDEVDPKHNRSGLANRLETALAKLRRKGWRQDDT